MYQTPESLRRSQDEMRGRMLSPWIDHTIQQLDEISRRLVRELGTQNGVAVYQSAIFESAKRVTHQGRGE
jgi:hypothetical protein